MGEHPSEDLAESGYTPDMKAKKIKNKKIIINADPPLFVAVYTNQSGDFFHYLRKNF